MKTNPNDTVASNALERNEIPTLGLGLTKRETVIFNIYAKIIADNFRGAADPDILRVVAENSMLAADILFEELHK